MLQLPERVTRGRSKRLRTPRTSSRIRAKVVVSSTPERKRMLSALPSRVQLRIEPLEVVYPTLDLLRAKHLRPRHAGLR